LQFAAREMTAMAQPFFATIFTLSSHNPYKIPENYKGRFPKGRLPIHESIGYLDFALQQFFAAAEKTPWFKDTIFVITADHTALSEHADYMDELGAYRVPLFIFSPRSLPAHDSRRLVQHVDIPATIFHLTGVRPDRVTLFGRSVFDAGSSGRVLNQASGQWWLLDGSGLTSTRDGGPKADDLAAWRQYFRNGVLDGSLWVEATQFGRAQ
jgi:phosphoglycerol transferase MdoB-like AlkP superfamily enzyme